MSKKFFKFITNDERSLDLSKMGLTPNDAIILNLKKSIYEILNDNVDLEMLHLRYFQSKHSCKISL